jgi:hypothetical protein
MMTYRRPFYYLRRHPVTDEIGVAEQLFDWNPTSGTWELPDDQPTLPHMVERTEFWETEEECLEARGKYLRGELDAVQ